MTTLFVYDYGIEYDNPLHIDMKSSWLNESQLIQIATKSPNVRNLRINRPVFDITADGANHLAQSWPRVEKLDLKGSRFNSLFLENLMCHFPLLTKLKMDAPYRVERRIFDTIFSNHPNLSDFECDFRYGSDTNWFRSCHVPLERFAVNHLWDEDATLDTLENCCENSLQTIKVGFLITAGPELIRRIFSTFHQLRDVSLSFIKYSSLPNQPVLRHLEKLCLAPEISDNNENLNLIDFLKLYPQLKELHLEKWQADDKFVEKITTASPNLRSLSFVAVNLTGAGWSKLGSLTELEYFIPGITHSWNVENVLAFVRETPSLKHLTIRRLTNDANDYLVLLRALRDDFRASGSNRRLSISRDDVMSFSVNSSETCSDQAIEEFVIQIVKSSRRIKRRC